MDIKSLAKSNVIIFLFIICSIFISARSIASDNQPVKNDNAISSMNLVLTENGSSSIFPPNYKFKRLEEVIRLNGERVSAGHIEYSESGKIIRLERWEKNRKGESVTKIYQDESGDWVKCVKWLIDGKESDVGKVVIKYILDDQGRIVKSQLQNSVWAREYIYNDDEQLTDVIEKQILNENNDGEINYPVRRYYYNNHGFIERRDMLTNRTDLSSTHYFDYGEHNILQRIIAVAKTQKSKRNHSEKYYSNYDHHHNWRLAEWGNDDNKFTKSRSIIYY